MRLTPQLFTYLAKLASSTARSRAETLRAWVSGNLAGDGHLPSMDARFKCYSLPGLAQRNGSKTVAATQIPFGWFPRGDCDERRGSTADAASQYDYDPRRGSRVAEGETAPGGAPWDSVHRP